MESRVAVQQNVPNIVGKMAKTARMADAMEDDGHIVCDCGTMVIRHLS